MDDEGAYTDDGDEAPVTSDRALEGAGSIKAALTEWLKHSTREKVRSEMSRSGIPDALDKVRHWTGDKRDPDKPPGLVARWLHPEEYEDFVALRASLMRPEEERLPKVQYPGGVRGRHCEYAPPEMWAPRPPLWIPRDEARVSRQEVAHTSRHAPISDRGATMDETGCITVYFEKSPLNEPKLLL